MTDLIVQNLGYSNSNIVLIKQKLANTFDNSNMFTAGKTQSSLRTDLELFQKGKRKKEGIDAMRYQYSLIWNVAGKVADDVTLHAHFGAHGLNTRFVH